jgi:hypothetical protein
VKDIELDLGDSPASFAAVTVNECTPGVNAGIGEVHVNGDALPVQFTVRFIPVIDPSG